MDNWPNATIANPFGGNPPKQQDDPNRRDDRFRKGGQGQQGGRPGQQDMSQEIKNLVNRQDLTIAMLKTQFPILPDNKIDFQLDNVEASPLRKILVELVKKNKSRLAEELIIYHKEDIRTEILHDVLLYVISSKNDMSNLFKEIFYNKNFNPYPNALDYLRYTCHFNKLNYLREMLSGNNANNLYIKPYKDYACVIAACHNENLAMLTFLVNDNQFPVIDNLGIIVSNNNTDIAAFINSKNPRIKLPSNTIHLAYDPYIIEKKYTTTS